MNSKKLSVAVIGYGYWSPKLIRNIKENNLFKLVVICEKDIGRHERIRTEHPDVEVLQHYKDVCNRTDIDAVIIATIPSSHYRISKKALEMGKHVLVEKPLTLSVEEGLVLFRLASSLGKVLMVDHTFLYNPAIQKLGELVKNGTLGKVYSIESIRTNLGLFQRDSNVVWDLAPHDFSIILAILPMRPMYVTAIGAKTVVHPKQERAQESVAHIMLHYSGDITVHIHVSWISPTKVRQLTVIGSEGIAVYDQLANNQLVIHEKGVYPNEDEGESGPLFIYKSGPTKKVFYEDGGEDIFRMLTDFGNSTLKPSHLISNDSLSLDVVRLLTATQYSLTHNGKRVRISYSSFNLFKWLKCYLNWR